MEHERMSAVPEELPPEELSPEGEALLHGEPPRVPKQKSKLKQREHLTALAFISVKYVGLIVFTVLPVFFALLYSLTNYNGIIVSAGGGSFLDRFTSLWNNFKNYTDLFGSVMYSDAFRQAILNNVIFLLGVPLGIVGGLVIAVVLSRDDIIRGSRVFRLLIYVPVVSSAVAMNIIWRYIFDNEYGIVNMMFGLNIPWLTDAAWIKVAIILKEAWGSLGKTMVLCLAALTNVGKDYYEAAELDGAGEITKFLKISVPLITPTLFYLLITGMIGNLQSYVDSDVFANGLPGAQTIVYFIWSFGIRRSYYGIASAASVILTIAILIITEIQFRVQDKWVYSE